MYKKSSPILYKKKKKKIILNWVKTILTIQSDFRQKGISGQFIIRCDPTCKADQFFFLRVQNMIKQTHENSAKQIVGSICYYLEGLWV